MESFAAMLASALGFTFSHSAMSRIIFASVFVATGVEVLIKRALKEKE